MGTDTLEAQTIPPPAVAGARRGRIVYLLLAPIDARDYKRYALGWMADQGYDVHVVDLADLIIPSAPRDRNGYASFERITIHIVQTVAAFRDLRSFLNDAALIMCMFGVFGRSLPVFQILNEVRAPYLLSYDSAIPFQGMAGSSSQGAGCLAKYLWWRFRQGRVAEALLLHVRKLFPTVSRIRPPAFVVFGGRRSQTSVYPIAATTQPIWAHAKDYDLYLEELRRDSVEKDIAVFIDEYLPYHRDLAALGNKPPMDAEEYYRLLRKFFDQVEQQLRLKVVIAACPRADYGDKPGTFGDREIRFMETPGLIRSSRVVIAHRSTAINYAVLFRKPVLLTTTRDIYRSHHKPYLEGYASALGQPLHFLDDPGVPDLTGTLTVDESVYAAFQENYIKTSGSPDLPFWEIVRAAVDAHMGRVGRGKI